MRLHFPKKFEGYDEHIPVEVHELVCLAHGDFDDVILRLSIQILTLKLELSYVTKGENHSSFKNRSQAEVSRTLAETQAFSSWYCKNDPRLNKQ
jgi:hypothetical protein